MCEGEWIPHVQALPSKSKYKTHDISLSTPGWIERWENSILYKTVNVIEKWCKLVYWCLKQIPWALWLKHFIAKKNRGFTNLEEYFFSQISGPRLSYNKFTQQIQSVHPGPAGYLKPLKLVNVKILLGKYMSVPWFKMFVAFKFYILTF